MNLILPSLYDTPIYGENPGSIWLIRPIGGCGLIAMHDGKISVLKVYNVRDVNLTMAALHVCLLLEYAMVTGQDWWDILLAVKPGIVNI
jgi:hypothetical protein